MFIKCIHVDVYVNKLYVSVDDCPCIQYARGLCICKLF